MNTHSRITSSLLGLFSLALAPTLPASTHGDAGSMHPVEVVNVDGRQLAIGSTAAQVIQVLGQPARTRLGDPAGKLDENVWVYYNIEGRGTARRTQQDDCHTFLVTMVDTGAGRGWRVREMKLVNPNAERFYTAQISARTTETLVAAR